MKRNLTLILFSTLLLLVASGCDRSSRRTEESPTAGATDTSMPAQPTLAPTDAPTTAPSASPAPEATATSEATPAASQSDQLAGQLDQALKDLDQQLGTVDTLDDAPPAP